MCVFSFHRRRQFLHLNVNVYGLDRSLSNAVRVFLNEYLCVCVWVAMGLHFDCHKFAEAEHAPKIRWQKLTSNAGRRIPDDESQ